MKRILLASLFLLSSCGSVVTPATTPGTNSSLAATQQAAARTLTGHAAITEAEALLGAWGLTLDLERAMMSSGETSAALVPTNHPERFVFFSDLNQADAEAVLVESRTGEHGQVHTKSLYLSSGVVVETQSTKSGEVLAASLGYSSQLASSDASILEALSYACQSARLSLVSANFALAGATATFLAVIAACAGLNPIACTLGIAGAQAALTAAAVYVESARLNVLASCS